MKQENFLFVDVISSIFLLVLLLCNFLGLLYITEGNMLVSLLLSALVVILYYFVLRLLKRNKGKMVNQGYWKTPATAFFAIYIIFGLVSYGFMVHLVNIETNCKKAIQKEAVDKIELIYGLKAQYEGRAKDALQTFEAQYKTKLQAYKNHKSASLRDELSQAPYLLPEAVLNSPAKDIDVAASASAALKAYQVKVSNTHKLLDSVMVPQANYYAKAFQEWDRLNISGNYNALNSFVQQSIDLINKEIKTLPVNNEPITVEVKAGELAISNPIALAKVYKPDYIIPFIIILLMHLFILIPYFTFFVPVYTEPKTDAIPGEVVKRGNTIEI